MLSVWGDIIISSIISLNKVSLVLWTYNNLFEVFVKSRVWAPSKVVAITCFFPVYQSQSFLTYLVIFCWKLDVFDDICKQLSMWLLPFSQGLTVVCSFICIVTWLDNYREVHFPHDMQPLTVLCQGTTLGMGTVSWSNQGINRAFF